MKTKLIKKKALIFLFLLIAFCCGPDVVYVAEDKTGEETWVEGEICKFQVEDQG